MEAIIGIKPAPGDHESNFKKVGSIPFGFNAMGTKINYAIVKFHICIHIVFLGLTNRLIIIE